MLIPCYTLLNDRIRQRLAEIDRTESGADGRKVQSGRVERKLDGSRIFRI